MCRYAMSGPYKPHYACFACRKSFKRRHLKEVNRGGEERPAKCPQCGLLMANMGLDFAPPKQRDVRAWKVLADLYDVGVTFHSCGCSGPGYRPRDPEALREFLEAMLEHYRECWAAAAHQEAVEGSAKTAAAHWRARAQQVEAVLAGV